MANKSYPRGRRVGDQVQRTLSDLLRREVRDPRLGMVTITEVRMSKDLAYATVFYSVLGADEAQAQEILDGAADQLRGPLGRALHLRHAPELRFTRDELIAEGARMSQLIHTAVAQDRERRGTADDQEQPPDSEDSDR
jgi:ribosome-binding factor A